MLPLSRIAEVKRIAGQPQIQREDLRRMVAVTARTSGSDLGSAVRRVQEVLGQADLLKVQNSTGKTSTISYALGGLYQEQQTAFAGLLWVFGAAIVLLLALLVYWYESIRVALCLVLTALLAASGRSARALAHGDTAQHRLPDGPGHDRRLSGGGGRVPVLGGP